MGSDFVLLVLSKGEHEVVVLDALTCAGNIRNLRSVWEDPVFHFMRGDICDPDIVHSAVNRSDAVIHECLNVRCIGRQILDPRSEMRA